MSSYPNLKNDPEFLKRKLKDDEIGDLRYKKEKHDHGNILKSHKIDIEIYKMKYKSLNKEKVFLNITAFLIGSFSTISSSALTLLNPSAGIIISSSTALITSIDILITNEHLSKLQIRCTEIRDWIKVITLLYKKISNNQWQIQKLNKMKLRNWKRFIINILLKKRYYGLN